MESVTLDVDAIKRLLLAIGGDPEDFRELAEDFCESTPGLVVDMRSATESSDWTALRIAAHTLKANAREFGATRLESLCRALEQQSIDSAVVDADSQIDAISICLVGCIAALEVWELPDA